MISTRDTLSILYIGPYRRKHVSFIQRRFHFHLSTFGHAYRPIIYTSHKFGNIYKAASFGPHYWEPSQQSPARRFVVCKTRHWVQRASISMICQTASGINCMSTVKEHDLRTGAGSILLASSASAPSEALAVISGHISRRWAGDGKPPPHSVNVRNTEGFYLNSDHLQTEVFSNQPSPSEDPTSWQTANPGQRDFEVHCKTPSTHSLAI